jgi:hypothetical protein
MSDSRHNGLDNAKKKDIDLEAELAQVQRTLSKSKEDVGAAATKSEESARPNGLPFSKARCTALVLTVTGASILNVCFYFILFLISDLHY